MRKWGKIAAGVLIVALLLSNFYLLHRSQRADYDVLIGVPKMSQTYDTRGVDFSRSQCITKKAQVDTVIFSLMHAATTEELEATERQPDAVLWISKPKENMTRYQADVWLEDDFILLQTSDADTCQYRVIKQANDVEQLKILIQSKIDLYQS